MPVPLFRGAGAVDPRVALFLASEFGEALEADGDDLYLRIRPDGRDDPLVRVFLAAGRRLPQAEAAAAARSGQRHVPRRRAAACSSRAAHQPSGSPANPASRWLARTTVLMLPRTLKSPTTSQ